MVCAALDIAITIGPDGMLQEVVLCRR